MYRYFYIFVLFIAFFAIIKVVHNLSYISSGIFYLRYRKCFPCLRKTRSYAFAVDNLRFEIILSVFLKINVNIDGAVCEIFIERVVSNLVVSVTF